MPAVKNVGEPCAGEPHARFDVAAGGNQTSRASTRRAVQAPLADPTARHSALDELGNYIEAEPGFCSSRLRKSRSVTPSSAGH